MIPILYSGDILADRYEIKKKIGEGASGCVYLAYDRQSSALRAIKKYTLKKAVYENEVRILQKAEHPGIPGIYHTLEGQQESYFVMDYAAGISLRERIAREGVPPPDEGIAIALKTAKILVYLHGLDPPVIYQDLKPEHIIIGPDGSVMLIDFGAAFFDPGANVSHLPVGTRDYAAPEQFQKGGSTILSDIYAYGKTISFLFPTTHELYWLVDHCTRENTAERPESFRVIVKILTRCMRKQKWKRVRIRVILLFIVSLAAVSAYFFQIQQEVYFEQGKKYFYEQKDYQMAAQYFDRLVQRRYPQGQYYSSVCTYLKGAETEEHVVEELLAFADYTDQMEESGQRIENYKIVGGILLALRETHGVGYEELADILEKGYALAQAEEQEVIGEYQFMLAEINRKSGYYEKAVMYYEAYAGKDVKKTAEIYLSLAEVYEESGEQEKAIHLFERLRVLPEDEWLDVLAEYLLFLARQDLKEAYLQVYGQDQKLIELQRSKRWDKLKNKSETYQKSIQKSNLKSNQDRDQIRNQNRSKLNEE